MNIQENIQENGAAPRPETTTGSKRSSVGYDLVLCTKRLVRAFDDPECARECKALIEKALGDAGAALAEAEVHGDFVIVRVAGVPADMSPAKAAAAVRSATSAPLRAKYPRISALSSLWNAALLARNAGEATLEDALAFKRSLDPRKTMR